MIELKSLARTERVEISSFKRSLCQKTSILDVLSPKAVGEWFKENFHNALVEFGRLEFSCFCFLFWTVLSLIRVNKITIRYVDRETTFNVSRRQLNFLKIVKKKVSQLQKKCYFFSLHDSNNYLSFVSWISSNATYWFNCSTPITQHRSQEHALN